MKSLNCYENHVSTAGLHTTNLQAGIHSLKLSGKFPLGLGISPLKIKIPLEANPLKSRILVQRLAVSIYLSVEIATTATTE